MTKSPLVLDLETAAPDTDPTPPPADWLERGIRDNFKDDTKDAYVRKNTEEWPKEWRRRASLDYRLGRIVAGGVCDGAETYLSTGEERGILTNLWGAIATARPLVGFVIKGFDWPWLLGRSALLGVTPSVRFNSSPYDSRQILDLADHLSHFGRFAVAGWTLAHYAEAFNLTHRPVGTGAEVADWVRRGELDKVQEHLEADLWTTWELWERCRGVYS